MVEVKYLRKKESGFILAGEGVYFSGSGLGGMAIIRSLSIGN